MNIRFEQPGDIEKIRKVHLKAFEANTEANLVESLRNSGVELISLLAEENGEVIGHILFSPVTMDGDIKIMGLAPMAVLPNWQRKGAGKQLINEGLKACEKVGYGAVVVLGHPDYYPQFGFVPSVNFGIKSEYDVPPEVFMVKELQKGALKGISGTVKYYQVFNEV
ncbi:MAG: N-acetyltransferase [Proteobacteria bacterium]|nr:N-acetyltransferase [Pseudomonadota bacterium]